MNATASPTPSNAAPPGPFDGDDVADEASARDDPFGADPHADDVPAAHAALPVDPAGRAFSDVAPAQLAQWIGAIVERDERALTALYDATVSRVYGIVLRVVRSPALAEEVVEDTYFQVWRQAVRFDPARGQPLTWLLGMARSRAIDAVRRESRFRHESLEADAQPAAADDAPGCDDLLEAARDHADLHRALMLLNAQPRQLVALAFFRGLSHEEIATHTRLPLGTVKSQIRRALATLRQALGDAGCAVPAS